MWNTTRAAKLFKVSGQTIRAYCDEFGAYLSPQASPGKGKTKSFTDGDMEVFALISELIGQGKEYPDAHAALMNGQRTPIPDNAFTIAASDQPQIIQLQLDLKFAVETVQQKELEVVRLTAQLEQRDADLAAARAEAKAEIRELYEEIADLKSTIKSLTR
jgi:DNA-binding transcriptional MerR regulator